MISDGERREVASRLRGFSDMAERLEAVGDGIDLTTSVWASLGMEPFARESEVLGRLADLVDRPACRAVGHEASGPVRRPCPNCGALVVDGAGGPKKQHETLVCSTDKCSCTS